MSSNRSKSPQGSGHSGTRRPPGASSIRSGLSARSSASERRSADRQSPIPLFPSSTQLGYIPSRRKTAIAITEPEPPIRTRATIPEQPIAYNNSPWGVVTALERQQPNETVIWDIYNEKAEMADKDLTTNFNSSMDVLLIFAGLFSAVLSAFIIETYKLLLPDQTDLTNQLLYAILQKQPPSSDVLSADFSPPPYAIRVNAVFFASLMVSLLTALTAMLVKQWVGYYEQGIKNINGKQIKARTRQFRYNGLVRWHLADIVALVPIFLHLSLFLFFIGVVDFLFAVAKPIAIASAAVISPGIFLYIIAHILPMASSGAPFRSPFTRFLDEIVLKLRRNRNLRQGPGIASEEKGYVAMEDPSSLWFGEDELEARTVQLTRTLDIEVVTWLLRHLDKKTERDQLDMCFEKLMAFHRNASMNASSFYRREIPLTYRQLARTCLDIGSVQIARSYIGRAGLLCRFLLWYLSLPRDEAQQQWLKEHLPLSETTFLQAAYKSSKFTPGQITTLTSRCAYRLLSHLHLRDNASCDACLGEAEIMEPVDLYDSANVIQELRSITECVLSRSAASAERIDRALDSAVHFIRSRMIGRSAQEFLQYLRSKRPSHPLGSRWCDTLIDAIAGLEEVVSEEPSTGAPSKRMGSDIAIPETTDDTNLDAAARNSFAGTPYEPSTGAPSSRRGSDIAIHEVTDDTNLDAAARNSSAGTRYKPGIGAPSSRRGSDIAIQEVTDDTNSDAAARNSFAGTPYKPSIGAPPSRRGSDIAIHEATNDTNLDAAARNSFAGTPYEPSTGTPYSGRGSDIAIHEATHDTSTPSPASTSGNGLLDKWLDGAYGPVLNPTAATVLGVKLQINPILSHRRSEPGAYRMKWNVLDAVHKAYLISISGVSGNKWYESMNASATFPRISSLVLHSNHLPGAIEVVGTSKSGAVTCGDVVIAIHEFCKKKISRDVYNSVSRSKRAKVDMIYHYNRSGKMGAAGPDFGGGGIRNGDFLEEFTSFDGLDDDEESVRLLLGLGEKRDESANDREQEETTTGTFKQRLWVGHLVLNLEYRSGENVSVPEEIYANEFPLITRNDLEDTDEKNKEVGYLEAMQGDYDTKPAKRHAKDNITYHQQEPVQYSHPFMMI